MPATARQYWRNLRGRCVLNFNWNAIDHDSVVHISASEYADNPADLRHSRRFLGSAPVKVSNVSPHSPPFDPNHGVTFVVNVDWGSPLNIVTDIIVLDAKPVATLWQGDQLAFLMERQQQSNWCWAANAVSVARYYNGASTWSQCGVANSQLSRTDCCGTGAGGACNVASVLDGPLRVVSHFNRMVGATISYTDMRTEIDAGRPLCVRQAWSGGGAHFLAILGYHANAGGEWVLVDDPIFGPQDVLYTTLVAGYQTTGSWTHTYFTQF
jgi:hypothetical protein